uniref:non-specific serine/threonine protein kinase n=1 Tax=Kalanchoe fedtschenkoi TaxID=63787 RepID=A0A7N0TV39_KALFE
MLRRFQLEELRKATNNFSQDCLLGAGGFGNVYRGTFEEGLQTVSLAIKKAHAESHLSIHEFRNEVILLSKVKHRNLVGLVGFCEEAGAMILVYEFAPNGSLLDHIMGRSGRYLTWRQRVNVAIGAAKGIAHLHEGMKPGIIHRDLKPSNILIGDGFEAKVSDFGLVKSGPAGDESHVSSQIKRTPGYLDPAYCSSFHLSSFSDVFSFGVILLQLIAARPAVDTASRNNSSKYHIIEWARDNIERGCIDEIVDPSLLLEPCNMEMMLKMGQLGLRCVVKVPKQWPTMTQVWIELEEALHVADNIHKNGTFKSSRTESVEHHKPSNYQTEYSVSIDGVGLQRFHVDMESISFQSTNLRCLDTNATSISVDAEWSNLSKDTEIHQCHSIDPVCPGLILLDLRILIFALALLVAMAPNLNPLLGPPIGQGTNQFILVNHQVILI